MELITAAELAERTGLSQGTISRLTKIGTLPTQEDSNGRRRFDQIACQQIIESKGIKPRARKGKEPSQSDEADEGQTIEASQSDQEAPGDGDDAQMPAQVQDILREALKRSQGAFKRSLKEQITQAQNDDEAPLDPTDELMLLRMYVKAGEVFDAVRSELLP